jgi:hypothetical protein
MRVHRDAQLGIKVGRNGSGVTLGKSTRLLGTRNGLESMQRWFEKQGIPADRQASFEASPACISVNYEAVSRRGRKSWP